MAGIAISTDEAFMLCAYYSAWSGRWVDRAQLQGVIRNASPVLWIGSYFDLAVPCANQDLVISDLSAGMLKVGREKLPAAMAVQADIRQLPFQDRFGTIAALGAVTAYLQDDMALVQAARSLKSALQKSAAARLLIDAYDIESIQASEYFNHRGHWHYANLDFVHEARMPRIPDDQGIFSATLTIAPAEQGTASATKHYGFKQRAFCSEHLSRLFEQQGLRLISTHTDLSCGRFYQVYTHAGLAQA